MMHPYVRNGCSRKDALFSQLKQLPPTPASRSAFSSCPLSLAAFATLRAVMHLRLAHLWESPPDLLHISAAPAATPEPLQG